jgi:hypothetical protein
MLRAAPGDDFGVHSVTFYAGAAIVGVVTTKPYRLGYRIPNDILCSGRTLTAVAEDSAGQTASASVPITIAPTDCAPIPGPTAPTLAFVNAPRRLDAKGATIGVNVSSSAGLKQVDYFLGDNKRCTANAAPWSCKVVPTGPDVGMPVLRAVASDVDGRTGEATARVEIPRFKPEGLSLSVDSDDRSHNRVRKSIAGQLRLPSNVTAAQGCASGHVTVVIKRSGRIVYDEQERLSKSCKFSSSVITQDSDSKRAFSVSARFSGNDVLLPVTASRRFS